MNNTSRGRPDGYDAWRIAESDFADDGAAHRETIFSQANGYLGLRGNLEEAGHADGGTVGAYLNGFYESSPIVYGETAYGYAKYSQTMLNVTDGQRLVLEAEGEAFAPEKGGGARRTLSLKTGVLTREAVFATPSGKRAAVRIERLVSFANRHLAAWRFEATPLNFSGRITFRTAVDGDVMNRTGRDDPRIGAKVGRALTVEETGAGTDFSYVISATKRSGLSLCCGMTARVVSKPFAARATSGGASATAAYTADAAENETVAFEKFLCYVDSREFDRRTMKDEAKTELARAAAQGFAHYKRFQADYLAAFWRDCGVEVEGDDALAQGIRYNMFQLLQSAGRDGRTSTGSKGLSGEGYEGHYFWDTEMYLTPFFIFTRPEIARKLLEYRFRTLARAKARAREMDHARGALYPWRTINGDECSAYFPAGTAQYHIDGDIAHAVRLYVEATGDERFLCDEGAEILVETARLWAGLGYFNPRKGGRFCINGVTGPDEYNVIVNNNLYTNMIAAENLRSACAACALLREKYPQAYAALCGKTGLEEDEPALWQNAADNVYIPYDDRLGIHPQDDQFLDRQPWDLKSIPAEKFPLLLHYHPLVIYRHRVCKQADMVLSIFLFPDRFTAEQKQRDYDFYEAVTTHDSSLSASIFSIVACALGDTEKAYRYFIRTARMDLDDRNGNTGDGIHTANMAGTWMGLTCGFGGMRIKDGRLCFSPRLPKAWSRLSFRVCFRGSRVQVAAGRGGVRYDLLSGGPLELFHRGRKISLSKPGDTAQFAWKAEDGL